MKTNFKSAHDQWAHFKSLAKRAIGPYSAEKKVYGMPLTDLVAIGLQTELEVRLAVERRAKTQRKTQ
jgi:hypothetical protein